MAESCFIVYMYPFFFIHVSTGGHLGSWLLSIILLRTYGCVCHSDLAFRVSLDKYPEVKLLGHFCLLLYYLAFVLKFILSGTIIATPAFVCLVGWLVGSIFIKYLFSSLYFRSVCVFPSEVSLM